MAEIEHFIAGYADAFIAAEAEGRETELFAALLGAELPVRAEDACRGAAHGYGSEPTGTARYVPSWSAYVVLCEVCAAHYEAR